MNNGSVIFFKADGNTEIGKELGNYEPNLSHIILLYKREPWRGFAIAVGMDGSGNNSSDFFIGQISGENIIAWKSVAMKQ